METYKRLLENEKPRVVVDFDAQPRGKNDTQPREAVDAQPRDVDVREKATRKKQSPREKKDEQLPVRRLQVMAKFFTNFNL